MGKVRLAIFVSGAGTNAMNIIHYFKGNKEIEVALLMTNNALSPIIEKFKNEPIEIAVS